MGRIFALLILFAAALPARAAPPIAAFGQLPTVGDIALSPDGKRWAAIIGTTQNTEVQVRDVATGTVLLASPASQYKLRSLQWADNDRIVLTISQTAQMRSIDYEIAVRGEHYQALMHDLTTHKWKRLLDNIPDTANVITDSPLVRIIDGRPQLIMEGFSARGLVLFRVDPANGTPRVIERGGLTTTGWTVDETGRAIARSDYVQADGRWRLMVRTGEGWKDVYAETAPIDQPFLDGLGRTPGTILIATRKSGQYETHEVSLATGELGPPQPELNDTLVHDPLTHRPIATLSEDMAGNSLKFWAESDQKAWRGIARGWPGEHVSLVDWSTDRQRVLVEVFGPKSGNAIFYVDRAARSAGLLSPRYAGISAADIGPVRTITYKAADGLDIPAFLTLPPGRAEKGLPLIVLPHGGPAANDSAGFDWWAQALASRGYAVLQPQFRGSTGFGAKFRDAGFGEWGRKMQTDVSDGVRHLATQGTIDPKRVCIVGASYGGYAAMAGVTVEQGVYRCASAVAGVSDLRRMLQREVSDAGSRATAVVRWWQRFMGASSPNDTSVDAYSPARLASRLSVPLQLIHGKDDLVVPFDQSRTMADAADKSGKPVDFITLAAEDHWLSRPATRIAMLEAQIAFLEKHNPPN
jgi:dipeptidyl aminopeptidase/acylaminoacyl peptidase